MKINKKILSLLLAAIMMISIATVGAYAENPKDVTPFAKGDPTGDGKISMLDVTEIQKFIASLITFDAAQKYAADVTFDDNVTMLDVTDMQRYIADLIVFAPVDSDTDTSTDTATDTDSSIGMTVNGKKFHSGDTVTYFVALRCTSGDITAIDAHIAFDTNLIKPDYSEDKNTQFFPVIHDEVVANIVENEGLYFNSLAVNKDYSGFDFSSGKLLVQLKFVVPELTESVETNIYCKISELVRYDANGFTDLVINDNVLSNSITITDSIA